MDIKARHTLSRELTKAIRDVRRGTKWRAIQGSLYQAHAGWFVSATPSVHMTPGVSSVAIRAKPMAIDPIFWEIFYPECIANPLSFRYNGAWVCPDSEVANCDVPEMGGADAMAAAILDLADLKLEEIEGAMTPEKFLHMCMEKNGDVGSYQACIICTLIALRRHAEALQVARHGQSQQRSGGFIRAGKSFNDLAVDWLTTSIAPRH